MNARRAWVVASVAAVVVGGLTFSLVSCGKSGDAPPGAATPEQKIERGKYLVAIAGCGDCHTPGVMQGVAVPEKLQLIGVGDVGWRGPWGTTYGSNLRQSAQAYAEDKWVQIMKSRKMGMGRPPMPWASLTAMTDADMAAIHAYIRSLGEDRTIIPAPVGPDTEPKTPYFDMRPKAPASAPAP